MRDKEKAYLESFSLKILHSNAFKNIAVIGIAGSIGRREKDIFDERKNDVDFFVIAEAFERGKKEELEKELRDLTNAKFTDILFLKERKFIKAVRKRFIDQYLFDLLKGNILLYASEKYARLFDELKDRPYKIARRSAVSVLITRLWCLTGPYQVVDDKILPIEENFTLYQIRKALTAIVDAILIHEGRYDSPNWFAKIKKFKQTSFFRMEREICSDLLFLFFNHKARLGFSEEVYGKVVGCYLKTIDYVIGNSLNSYFRFPLKGMLIMSVFRRDLRTYIRSAIKKYKTLVLVSKFLGMSSKRTNAAGMAFLFKEIYAEAVK